YASFESIRDAQNHGQVPVVGKVVPVQYRMVPGPAAEEPKEPPNLRKHQAEALLNQMIIIQGENPSRPEITQNQLSRLVRGLVFIDIKFVDPISTQRWDAILQSMAEVARQEYARTNQGWDTIIDHMLQKAFKELKEPHSTYFDAAQTQAFMQSMTGKFSGIGVGMSSDPLGMKVELVYPNSGASRADLRENDVIAWVDGRCVKGLPVEDIVKLIGGPAGTSVVIKIIRDGQLRDPVKIMRAEVEAPNAFSKMASPGIGYVYFSEFREKTDKQVFSLIRELRAQGARAVILDVRGNPGGFVPTVASIASEFLRDKDEIVSFKHQGQVAAKAVTKGDGIFADIPVIVLIDGFSASASEILSAALQDKRRGYTVIGSRSYGKGTQQVIMEQGDGRSLKITENRWHTPNDRNIDARHDPKTGEEIPGTGGVVPDIIVSVTAEQAAKIAKDIRLELFGRPLSNPRAPDPVLDKAIEVLSSGKAR
ncbi:MAG TPA: hypothetical protein DEB40_00715, partial [Elusimicrobia bacterium]|nr:hypothetical protein [Elusimicrobiota bacterium]HBT60250.1 hypothetical protein [Elusimicrobiota bacterium]